MRRLQTLGSGGGLVAAASARGGAGFEALLASRLDLEQYLLELPPMSDSRAACALRYRLASLYPGDLDSAEIDFVRNGAKGKGYALFAMRNEALARYRAAAPGSPLVSSTLLGLDLAPRGPWICVFWTRAWASLESFQDGRLTRSRRMRRSGELEGDWSRLMEPRDPAATAGVAEATETTVFVAEDASADFAGLEGKRGEPGATELCVLPLAKALSRVRLSHVVLFPLRGRLRARRSARLWALGCVDALLLAASMFRYSGELAAEEASLREDCLRMQKQNGAALRLMDEASAKEKSYESLIAGKIPDAYLSLASIALGIGEKARILSLVIKENGFQLEAEGRDALATLASLEKSPGLEGLRLVQSLPGKGGMERFSMTGSFGNDGDRAKGE